MCVRTVPDVHRGPEIFERVRARRDRGGPISAQKVNHALDAPFLAKAMRTCACLFSLTYILAVSS
jgi:hypothetical protein